MRKKGFLLKYGVIFDEKKQFYLKLSQVRKFTNSNVHDLFNTEIADAHKIYFDTNGLTDRVPCICHNLNENAILSHLEKNNVLYLKNNDFLFFDGLRIKDFKSE